MNNSTTWILIADSSEAKIFGAHLAKLFQPDCRPDELKLLHEFTHSASRLKEINLTSDRKGEFGSSTYGEPSASKKHEAHLFAHELLQTLTTAHNSNSYHDLILIAPANFMGLMQEQMPTEIAKLIRQRIEKDYIHLKNHELLKTLLPHL